MSKTDAAGIDQPPTRFTAHRSAPSGSKGGPTGGLRTVSAMPQPALSAPPTAAAQPPQRRSGTVGRSQSAARHTWTERAALRAHRSYGEWFAQIRGQRLQPAGGRDYRYPLGSPLPNSSSVSGRPRGDFVRLLDSCQHSALAPTARDRYRTRTLFPDRLSGPGALLQPDRARPAHREHALRARETDRTVSTLRRVGGHFSWLNAIWRSLRWMAVADFLRSKTACPQPSANPLRSRRGSTANWPTCSAEVRRPGRAGRPDA